MRVCRMKELIKYVLENVYNNKMDKDTGANLIKLIKEDSIYGKCDIAIIGIGTTLPGCDNLDGFWENVKNGVTGNRKIPDGRKKDMDTYFTAIGQTEKTYLECSYLDAIDQFDYNFFHISPNEAKTIDPYQRLFLQTVYQSIEDAGYGGKRLCGSNTGVFVGYAPNANDCYYKMLHDINDELDPNVLIGNIAAIIPSRISYLLDLHGPAMLIDTACSSSLVAVHEACLHLKNTECSMAIAGGIKVNLLPVSLESTQIGLSSSDGLTRSFDNHSEGTGKGEGIISLVLKPLEKALEDRDHVYAVLKGSAVNQDGKSMGLTAPNPMAQKDVILNAWKASNIDPKSLAYVEVHGTGTKLGDPIEVEALNLAFRHYTAGNQCIPVSTVKSVYGHLYECSGMAGLLNAIMAIKHREIPPCLNFNTPNSNIEFANTALYVNTKLQKYKNAEPMRCAVSSFGLSGTNCHMVLEEAPMIPACMNKQKVQVLCLSAKTKTALHTLINNYKAYLKNIAGDALQDICYTANLGRGHYSYRVAITAHTIEELKEYIDAMANQTDWSELDFIYYGFHKVVSPSKVTRKSYEITESAVKKLTNLSNQLINGMKNVEESNIELLQLAELYAQGADVDFQKLYQSEDYRAIALPTYPFEGNRCWLDIDNLYPEEEQRKTISESDILHYTMQWQEQPLKSCHTITDSGESILIITGESIRARTFLEEVKHRKREIIVVTYGASYLKKNSNEYQITATWEDFNKLVLDLKSRNIVKIIETRSLDYQTESNLLGQVKERLHFGIYALQKFVKTILTAKWDQKLELILITNQSYEIDQTENFIISENAMLHGFGQVISKEAENILCYSIDIDENTHLSALFNEVCAMHTQPEFVAYRNNIRYLRIFASQENRKLKGEPIEVAEGNVYLVTGGLGGIGFELSKYFALKNSVHLVFTGQTQLPQRSLWKEPEKIREIDVAAKLKKIQEIEQLGSTIDYFNVDVSNLEEMETIIRYIHTTYGKIHGVIHCAGISADKPLLKKEEEEFSKVIKPKVEGTFILNKLTENDSLEFFIMSSSIATILSMQGQSDYVAANAYMDSFSNSHNRSGKRMLTINWTTWKETGMAYTSGFAVDTIFKALPTKKAVEGFEQLLESEAPQGVIGIFNYDGIGIPLLERSGIRLSTELRDKVNRIKNLRTAKQQGMLKKVSVSKNTEQVSLTGREDGSYNEMERTLADICRKTLGFGEIDVYENFFEMGADSIILMKIQAEIEAVLTVKIHPADMFEHSTVAKLAEHMIEINAVSSKAPKEPQVKIQTDKPTKDIAIIGMALQFPMAEDKEELWQNVHNKLDCIGEPPKSRKEEVIQYAKYRRLTERDLEFNQGGYINGADSFDYSYFRIPPKEAKLIDPNQRIFLQTAIKAIEDAGYGGKKITGSNTGVYLGFASTQMYLLWYINETQADAFSASLIGNTAAVASGRLSYLLDLKGPSIVIDTACSSSLVAVHTACKALQAGDCDMALAGGVRLNMVPVHQKGTKNGIGMDSTDGRARTFDYDSDGTGSGEGVGALLLKPLDEAIRDNDNIYAVVKGSAVNQDGSSAGITAPNPAAQEEVIVKAWQDAGIDPETIGYIETHGTGTPLGDPIEIQGIKNAFNRCTTRKQFCAVSSVKSNIAHLSEAAGIAGVLNAVMALQKKELPPSKYFIRPNKDIEFDNSPVYVNTIPRKWTTNGHLRRCGISAFGMSGTNCHVVLEEYDEEQKHQTIQQEMVFTLSAKTKEGLQKQVIRYIDFLNANYSCDIADICYTANTGREAHNYRVAFILRTLDELLYKLKRILSIGFCNQSEELLYYGYHKIVSERTQELNENEITEYNKREFTQRADTIFSEETREKEKNLDSLKELCKLYVLGADIDWDNFYRYEIRRRVSLPTYPFEDKHCWIDVPEYEEVKSETYGGSGYYQHQWIEAPNTSNQRSIHEVTVVLKGRKKICTEFIQTLKQSCEVIEVELAAASVKVSKNHYRINGQQDGYDWLFSQIKHRNIQRIVHMLSLEEANITNTLEELKSTLQKGVYSLFRVSKAITQNSIKNEIDFLLISECADQITGAESINPSNAAIFGLGKAIRLESANQICRSIDINEEVTAAQLIEELKNVSKNYHTAYRADKKYISIFKEYEPDYEPGQTLTIKDGNVYIITGGTGGMALEMGLYLAGKARIKLVLLSRSDLPLKSRWNEILKYSRDWELIHKIKKIMKIEETGSEVLYYQTDVSDFETMQTTFDSIHQNLGSIHGVIHTAGLGGGGFIFQKEEQTFTDILAPKVYGTWILNYLTQTDTLDFFIMCSSIASIFPGMGQGDYAAANAYLDAFAAYKSTIGQRALAINWVAWKDTGMAIKYGVNTDDTFKALSTPMAMKAFDELVHKKISRAVVGEINYSSEKIALLKMLPIQLSKRLEKAVWEMMQKTNKKKEALTSTLDREVTLKGRENKEYSEVENKLAMIYSKILGFEEIDIYDNFFELGGDSILLSRMYELIDIAFPGKFKLLDLFEYTSISKLSAEILLLSEKQEETQTMDTNVELEEKLTNMLNQVNDGELSVDEMLDSISDL